jgi:MFS family permease
VAASGYALSAVCKLGLLAAGNAWAGIMAATALDRFGKGIRTAPRDALISMSSEPEKLGLAFGVHRAMDTAGALLGPLVAFGVLAMMPDAYDVIFVASFCVAIVGLAAILLFVKDVRREPQAEVTARPSIGSALGLLRNPAFRAVTLAGSALGLVTVADSFFYLVIQRRDSITLSSFPLLYVATAITYLVFAIPAGRLCDRVGRGRVFLLGHVLLLGASTSLLLSGPGILSGILSLGLLGAYYACTDGVLMAAATPLVPLHLRATGLSILTTAIGVARLCASVAFGAIWSGWGIETALAMFCIGLAAALALTYRTLVPL